MHMQAAVDKEERTTKKKSFVSSTALTPGTRFMHDIAVSLAHYVCARLVQYKWREVGSLASCCECSLCMQQCL